MVDQKNILDSFSQSVRGIRGFSYNLAFATSQITSFTSSLVSGGPIIQGFLGQIENLASTVLKYSTQAFNDASAKEVDAIAGAGSIANVSRGLLSYTQGAAIFEKAQIKLAGDAAVLPGATSEYTTAFAQLVDDVGGALYKAGDTVASFSDKIMSVTGVVKDVVLQSKLYGQNVPISSIIRSYGGLLATGLVKNNEIFFKRNPVIKNAISDYEKKEGRKLSQMTTEERAIALPKIFGSTISPAQMTSLLTSFQSKFEGFKSNVIDPKSGLFGFERKFKGSDGKDVSMFETLSKLIKPVLNVFSDLAVSLIKFGDPLKYIASILDGQFRDVVTAAVLALSDFIQMFNNSTEINFMDRVNDALKKVFNFDLTKFDLSDEVDKFFKKIVDSISGINTKVSPDNEMGQVMRSILFGMKDTILAVLRKAGQIAWENPQDTASFVAVTNPGLIMQGVTALAAATSLIVTVLTPLAPILNTVITGAMAFSAAIGVAIASVVAGVLVAIDYFKVPIIDFANWINDAGEKLGGTLGWAMEQIAQGIAGMTAGAGLFVDGLKKLLKGDILGAIKDMVTGLFFTLGGLMKTILGGLTAAFGGFWDILIKVKNYIANKFFGGNGATEEKTPVLVTDGGFVGPIDNRTNLTPEVENILNKPTTNNYSGNALGNLLGSIAKERLSMPSGAGISIANSSEAILPKNTANNVLNSLTNSGKSVVANIVINGGSDSANDIGAAIRRELGLLMSEV